MVAEELRMPIHDWSLVDSGLFHDFHQAWIASLRMALNQGALPPGFYSLIEQRGQAIEYALAEVADLAGTTTLLETLPKVDLIQQADDTYYAAKQSSLVIRRKRNDRIVAIVEVVSAGNKSSDFALERFVDKVAAALFDGIHVVIIDLHPPQRWDPRGIHDSIWRAVGQKEYHAPQDKPLTLAAYSGLPNLTAYVQPSAVGDTLAGMPLFLEDDRYIELPLEATYETAFSGVPAQWRRRLSSS
jgi:hypothetical protein